jgi:hypothetical protein
LVSSVRAKHKCKEQKKGEQNILLALALRSG